LFAIRRRSSNDSLSPAQERRYKKLKDDIISEVKSLRLIREKPIAPGSPWQNGFAERLIGSIRRECVDHVVVLGEAHLRRILTKYATYYNELRTHRSLNKDAPIHRAILRPSLADFTTIIAESNFRYRQRCQ
jgi:transposase InsO family protein